MTTPEALQQQINALEATQVEARLLYQISSRLNTTQNEAELLNVLAQPGIDTDVAWAALYNIIDLDETGQPAWAKVATVWPPSGGSPLPVGMRFYLPQFPFTALWITQPHQPLFITNVTTDNRLDRDTRNAIAQNRTRGLVVIPLIRAGRWTGLISLSWANPHTFSDLEKAVYQTFTSLASPVAESQQLLARQHKPLVETLFSISQQLHTAQNEENLLQILIQPSLETGVMLSTLSHLDLDETGQPAWTEIVATWQRDSSATAVLIAAIWSQISISKAQAQDGSPLLSTGTRYYLPEFPFTPLWLSNTNEPQLIADITTDGRVNEAIRNVLTQAGIRAMALIPLLEDGRWVGIINLFWDRPYAFSEAEIAVYRALGNLATPTVIHHRQAKQLTQLAAKQTAEAAFFKDLAQNSGEAIAVSDLNGHHTYVNRAYANLFDYDYDRQELIGSPLSTLLTDEELAAPAPKIEKLDEFGVSKVDELQELLTRWQGAKILKRKDGSAFPANITAFILSNEAGEPFSLAMLVQDLAQLKQAEAWVQAHRNLNQSLAATPKLEDALTLCLETACQISGLERGRLYLVNENSTALTLVAQQNVPADTPQSISLDPDAQLTQLLTSNHPIYADSQAIDTQPDLSISDANLQSVSLIPIYHQDQHVAVLHLASPSLDQVPDFAPVPLETIGAHVAGIIAKAKAAQILQDTRTQAQAKLQEMQTQAQAELKETRAQAQAELKETRAQAQAKLQETQTQAETQLKELRTQAQAELQETQAKARADLKETKAKAKAELQNVRLQAETTLQETKTQLEAALQEARNNAKAKLQDVRTKAKTQLQETRTQAETALQEAQAQTEAERQARTTVEARLQETQTQLEAESQTRTKTEVTLQKTRTQAETNLKEAKAQTEAERQARTTVEAELQATRTKAKTDLKEIQAQAAATLQEAREQAKANQHHHETVHQQLLTSMSDWVWSVDLDGRFTASNQTGHQLLGHKASQLAGKSIFTFIQTDDQPHIQELFQQAVAEQTGWSELTIPWLHQDGSVRFSRSILHPILDSTGQLCGFKGIDYDLTPQKQAEAERIRFNNQLRAAANIVEQVNATRDPDTLLNEAVTLLQTGFDLYHVQIYVLDEATRELVMRVCAGQEAEQLQTKGHKISLDYKRSLVTRAARGLEIVRVNDVSTDPNFTPHPALPNTRSKLVVPIANGEQLLGVLDAQDESPHRFSQSEVDIFNTLAGYIATSLTNIHLLKAKKHAEAGWAALKQQAQKEQAALKQQTKEKQSAFQQQLIDVRQQAIQELPNPVIPIMNHIIVMPLIGPINAARTQNITQAMLTGISQHQAKMVVLDVTGVPVVDSNVTNHLNKAIQAAQLKGVQAIVTGLPDSVAETIAN